MRILLISAAATVAAHSLCGQDNDQFANRIVLTGEYIQSTSLISTETTGKEIDEPGGDARSIWWEWTAPATGNVTITTQGSSDFDKGLFLFQGESLANLKWADAWAWDDNYNVTFPVAQGTNLKIKVGSRYSSASGDVTLTIALNRNADVSQLNLVEMTTTENDAFAQRRVITGATVSASSFMTSAGTEILEPHDYLLRSVWWEWTAPATGTLYVSSQFSSDFDKAIYAYMGDNFTNLRFVAGTGWDEYPSFSFPVIEGTTYLFKIGSRYSSASGHVFLNLTLNSETVSLSPFRGPPEAQNDHFVNRAQLRGNEVSSLSYAASYSGNEPFEPDSMSGSIWWEWIAPASGRYSLNTEHSAGGGDSIYEKGLHIYTGDTLQSLEYVASDDRDTLPTVSFDATEGTSYKIKVERRYDRWQHIVLNLSGPAGENRPQITSWHAASGVVNRLFSYQIQASGGNSYAAYGLPPGLSVNASTGEISGAPLIAGYFPVSIVVSNGTLEDSANLRIHIGEDTTPHTSFVEGWIWSLEMDSWVWVSNANYPYMWRTEDSTWIWYLLGTSGPRWILNTSTQSWEQYD